MNFRIESKPELVRGAGPRWAVPPAIPSQVLIPQLRVTLSDTAAAQSSFAASACPLPVWGLILQF